MSDSIFLTQQRREVENRGRFYDWALVKQSILEAKGARECADVAAEKDEAGWAMLTTQYTPSLVAEAREAMETAPTLVDQLWSDLQR